MPQTEVQVNGAKSDSAVVTRESVENLLYRWASMPSKLQRLFAAVCAMDNPQEALQEVQGLIAELRAAARSAASKNFTFEKGHQCEGLTGRDALNAITDDRESNGKVRQKVKAAYRAD
ncbi:MAG: hypothetical protein AMXMBFR13_07010 [Phycisphaerae bacterium]